MANPLATARQLWRLNKEGRLALVDKAQPIPSSVADAAIKGEAVSGRCCGDPGDCDGCWTRQNQAMDGLDGLVGLSDGTTAVSEA